MSRACVSRGHRSYGQHTQGWSSGGGVPESRIIASTTCTTWVKNYAKGHKEEDAMIGGVPASRVHALIIAHVSLTNRACVHCKIILWQAASSRYALMVWHLHKLAWWPMYAVIRGKIHGSGMAAHLQARTTESATTGIGAAQAGSTIRRTCLPVGIYRSSQDSRHSYWRHKSTNRRKQLTNIRT